MRSAAWSASAVLLVAACSGPAGDTTGGPAATAVVTAAGDSADETAHDRLRRAMTEDLEGDITDSRVLAAMEAVPRHRFVPDDVVGDAYDDRALPIGYGQTISQPYIVALMSSAVEIRPGDRVLEVGTGSGYQAAVLAELGADVYTVEIIPELADRAAAALTELGYDGVETRTGDGYVGWEEAAPFDAVIVTAAPDHLPQPLVRQLAPGGRLVIPIGPIGAVQTLWVFAEDDGGELVGENLGAVRFVPFTR